MFLPTRMPPSPRHSHHSKGRASGATRPTSLLVPRVLVSSCLPSPSTRMPHAEWPRRLTPRVKTTRRCPSGVSSSRERSPAARPRQSSSPWRWHGRAWPWNAASINAIPNPSTDSPLVIGVIAKISELLRIRDFSGSVIQPRNIICFCKFSFFFVFFILR